MANKRQKRIRSIDKAILNLSTNRQLLPKFPSTSGIYVLCFENGIKIGKAKNLKSRVNSYCSPWCRKIQEFHFVETKHIDIAERYVIHELSQNFRKEKYTSEFFQVKEEHFHSFCNYVTKAVKDAENIINCGSNVVELGTVVYWGLEKITS